MSQVKKSRKPIQKLIDLSTVQGKKAWDSFKENENFGISFCYNDLLLNFLETNKYDICFGKYKIFPDDYIFTSFCAVYNNKLFIDQFFMQSDFSSFTKNLGDPDGILVDTKKRTAKNKKFKQIILSNGDINEGSVSNSVEIYSEHDMPTTSFDCLNRFYNSPKNLAIDRLAAGKLKVVDYTCDDRISLTKKEKAVKDKRSLKAPKPGFSLVGNEWHRSGSVLFQDQEKDLCILTGQDEGTYFGVQLPKKVKTIEDAFRVLIPKEVIGKAFQRQGEWFMVPIAEKDVPDYKDCLAVARESICLPIDSKDSNRHEIFSSMEIKVGKDSKIYVFSPTVYHDDHLELTGKNWNTFYKNTALRSFSQEGVD